MKLHYLILHHFYIYIYIYIYIVITLVTGDYVEFTPKNAFNAIVVRFSIPNTPNGQGQAANLSTCLYYSYIRY